MNNLDLHFDICETAGTEQLDRTFWEFESFEFEGQEIQADHKAERKDKQLDKDPAATVIVEGLRGQNTQIFYFNIFY